MLADGFPRTALQVDFLKLLFDKLMALHGKHADGPDENRFPRPSFKVRIVGAASSAQPQPCLALLLHIMPWLAAGSSC